MTLEVITRWRRPIEYFIFIGYFLQKSPVSCGSFSERDLQLNASCASLPPCIRCMPCKVILRSTTLEVGCSGSTRHSPVIISSLVHRGCRYYPIIAAAEPDSKVFPSCSRRIIFHSHARTQAHAHTHAHKHTHPHTHTYTHTHTRTHTHTYTL